MNNTFSLVIMTLSPQEMALKAIKKQSPLYLIISGGKTNSSVKSCTFMSINVLASKSMNEVWWDFKMLAHS